MRNLIFLFLMFLSFSSFAQNWKEIKTENNMVFQTLGRAGRLGFKDYGRGIVLVRSERMRRSTEIKR